MAWSVYMVPNESPECQPEAGLVSKGYGIDRMK